MNGSLQPQSLAWKRRSMINKTDTTLRNRKATPVGVPRQGHQELSEIVPNSPSLLLVSSGHHPQGRPEHQLPPDGPLNTVHRVQRSHGVHSRLEPAPKPQQDVTDKQLGTSSWWERGPRSGPKPTAEPQQCDRAGSPFPCSGASAVCTPCAPRPRTVRVPHLDAEQPQMTDTCR